MITTLGSLSPNPIPTPQPPPPPTISRHKPSRPSRESKLRQITDHGSLRKIQQGQSGRNCPSIAIKANHKEPINTHYCIKWWVMLKLAFVFFPFVQFATNIKMVCDNWNISTALWLRRLENFNSFMPGKSPLYSILGNIFVFFRTVYERCSRHRTLAVFITSSVWHGFYPGYYMMFLSLALFIEAARMASIF